MSVAIFVWRFEGLFWLARRQTTGIRDAIRSNVTVASTGTFQ